MLIVNRQKRAVIHDSSDHSNCDVGIKHGARLGDTTYGKGADARKL